MRLEIEEDKMKSELAKCPALSSTWASSTNGQNAELRERTPQCYIEERFLTPDECKSLIALSEEINSDYDQFLRTIDPATMCTDLLSKIDGLISRVNESKFQLSLHVEKRSIQLLRYRTGNCQSWHSDVNKQHMQPRQLSASIQLSTPSDYEGGELQFSPSDILCNVPKTQGTIVLFPSWLTHRVTPVTAGLRWSLVVWAHGPNA